MRLGTRAMRQHFRCSVCGPGGYEFVGPRLDAEGVASFPLGRQHIRINGERGPDETVRPPKPETGLNIWRNPRQKMLWANRGTGIAFTDLPDGLPTITKANIVSETWERFAVECVAKWKS